MKVVIIDDAQLNVTLLQHLVRKLPDCEPVCFTDPVAGLAWCLANDPDLIIVDCKMPQLSGIELVEPFRKHDSDIAVLMVTANHETDFLNKPLDNIEFLARARNMLALRQSHKQLADQASWLAEEVRKATAQSVEREQETIFCLAQAAEYRDPETGAHILRMVHYSNILHSTSGSLQSSRICCWKRRRCTTSARSHRRGRQRLRCAHIGPSVQESMGQRTGSQLLREGAGTHFDPACVDAFFAEFDEVLKIKSRFVDEEIELGDRALG